MALQLAARYHTACARPPRFEPGRWPQSCGRERARLVASYRSSRGEPFRGRGQQKAGSLGCVRVGKRLGAKQHTFLPLVAVFRVGTIGARVLEPGTRSAGLYCAVLCRRSNTRICSQSVSHALNPLPPPPPPPPPSLSTLRARVTLHASHHSAHACPFPQTGLDCMGGECVSRPVCAVGRYTLCVVSRADRQQQHSECSLYRVQHTTISNGTVCSGIHT